jgi:hypothetical protein
VSPSFDHRSTRSRSLPRTLAAAITLAFGSFAMLARAQTPPLPDTSPSESASSSASEPGGIVPLPAPPVAAASIAPLASSASSAVAPAPSPPPAHDAYDPRVADAHADRVVILPTAYTHPAGTLYFTTYDIVLLQAGYALTDHTQISITATPPIATGNGTERVFPLDLSLKTAIVHAGLVRVALIASTTGIMGLEQGNFLLGRFGGVAQLCFEETCASSVSMGTTVVLAGPATLALTGVGIVWRFASWGAFLFEADTLVPLGRQIGQANGLAIMAGFRFPHRTWSLDLSAVRPLGVSDAATIPLLSFTYRFL